MSLFNRLRSSLYFSLSFVVIIIKALLVVRGYRYIDYGTDSARILAQAEETVASGRLPGDISPRVFLPILAAFEQQVFGLAPQFVLLPITLLGPIVSLIIVDRLAKEISTNWRFRSFAILFYSLALVISPPNNSNLFGILFVPILTLLFIRFLLRKMSILPLVIGYLGSFLVYSPLLFVVNFIFSIFIFLKFILLGGGPDIYKSERVKNISLFFLLMPMVFLFYFPFDNASIIPSYRGIMLYFWRVFGLWISKSFFLTGTYLIAIYMIFSIGLFFLFYFGSDHVTSLLLQARRYWLNVFSNIKSRTKNTNLPNLICPFSLGFYWIFGSILVFDLVSHLAVFPRTFRESYFDPRNFVSYRIAGFLTGVEVWREIFLPVALLIFLSIPIVGNLIDRKSKRTSVLGLYLLFLLLFFVTSSFSGLSVVSLVSGYRGLIILTPFVSILAAASTSDFKQKLPQIGLLCLLFVYSFGTAIYPNSPVNQNLIRAADYYRLNIADSRLLILSTSDLSPDEATEKYYSESFIPNSIAFAKQSEINQMVNKSCGVPNMAIKIVHAENYRYVFLEPGFDRRVSRQFATKTGSKAVYNKGQVTILKI